jgi:hypothetical protein
MSGRGGSFADPRPPLGRGAYPRLTDYEWDRDRFEARASQRNVSAVTRLLCVPDTVDPRADSRWL